MSMRYYEKRTTPKLCAERCRAQCFGKPRRIKCANRFIEKKCNRFSRRKKKIVLDKCLAGTGCGANQRLCANGNCVATGACCPNETKCPNGGSCVAAGTCCPGETKCADGKTCVPAGTCCDLDRQCLDQTCILRQAGFCCSDETKCSDGTCIPRALNVTCTQIATSTAFFTFIDTVNSSAEALSTVDPKLVNDLVDTLRSIVGEKQAARITPDSVINIMFPNPNATFDFSDFDDLANMTENSRALALYVPNSVSTSHAPSLYAPSSTFALPDGCLDASITAVFWDLVVVFSAVGMYRAAYVDKAKKTAETLMKLAGGTEMIAQTLAFVKRAWLVSKLSAGLFMIRFFSNLASFFGLKLVVSTYMNQLGPWDYVIGGATMLLSLAALCLTDGLSLADQILGILGSLPLAISSSLVWYDTCFPATCTKKNRELSDLLDCDDGNLCTIDRAFCEDEGWVCSNTPVTCYEGYSCDRSTGHCRPNDDVVPCVAVIDEDSSFGIPDQATLWSQFRATYPSRPFCLLVPGDGTDMNVPQNFLDDSLAAVQYNIIRDNGDSAQAEDWYKMCAIDLYTSSNTASVGLFVDNSGSLTFPEVQASYNLFQSNVQKAGIVVQEVVNSDENWILPFLTTLVPTQSCTADGKPGQCLVLSKCADIYKKSVPYKLGDPEPSCRKLAYDIQCCVPYSCTAEGKPGDCRMTADCQALGKKSVPWMSGDPEPNCSTLPTDVQCCI